MSFPRFTYDAAQGLSFLQSQLAAVEKKVFEVKYEQINYNVHIPISTEAGEYATSVDYFFMDGAAVAEFVGSKSIDVPIADIGMDKVSVPVELGAVGYEYSHEEVRQAMWRGIDLNSAKASVARRAYEQLSQRTAMIGNTKYNLPGFVNNANVTAVTVVDPGGGTTWAAKTADQILFDISDLFSDAFAGSLMNERPNKLLLPPGQWSYISMTPRASNSDTTILQYVAKNSVYLNSPEDIQPLYELTGAGAGATDRMMIYTKDPDKVVMHIPMPLRFYTPQEVGRGFQIPGEFKLSGVEFRYPGSARYGDGI